MQKILNLVNERKKLVFDAEKYLWSIPEPGYKEFKTNEYMIKEFEKLGYTVKKADGITGFSAQIDTGKKGPTIVVCAELDALYSKEHPATSAETGCVHACGHHIQLANILGVASIAKDPEFLKDLCGVIKFVIVPAEEGIEIAYRQQLIKQGKISFSSGKPEFISRGFFDDTDICFMVHASSLANNKSYAIGGPCNGVIRKTTEIYGKASHAGGSPHKGINALNAATTALTAINNLRETFLDDDHIRVHSIITQGGASVNVVPDKIVIESYVRGADSKKLKQANDSVNRAIVSSCAIFGAKCKISDVAGSEPLNNDPNLKALAGSVMEKLVGKDGYVLYEKHEGSSTDMGDVSQLFPAIHAYSGGTVGALHSKEFGIVDYEIALTNNVNFQTALLYELLKDGAKEAQKIIDNFTPTFSSFKEYLEYKKSISCVYDGVEYLPNGKIELTYKN